MSKPRCHYDTGRLFLPRMTERTSRARALNRLSGETYHVKALTNWNRLVKFAELAGFSLTALENSDSD